MQLGNLVATMPNLTTNPTSPAVQQWLGQAYAHAELVLDATDLTTFKTAAARLETSFGSHYEKSIALLLHRALAKAELKAPISAQGAFIPAGNAFDAFAIVGKVLAAATRDLLIVDPYMDEKALTDFVPLAREGVAIRLLADQAGHKPTLKPAAARWAAQYGIIRPLQARLTAPHILHDRLIAVDGSVVWTLTQSLNAFAARSPATIAHIDPETAAMKIPAYEAMWQAATPL